MKTGSAIACSVCEGPLRLWCVKRQREVYRCPACGLITVPAGVVTNENGLSIYEDDNNIFEAEGNEGYYFDDTNLQSCSLKIKWLQEYVPPGARLIDAGANFGHFLKVAQETYDAAGFDLSPQEVHWSREHFGVVNYTASIYSPPVETLKAPADVVTSWDVLEHIPDPRGALERLHGLVKPGGFLFLSTPDAGSAAACLLGRFWHYLDPIQHINLFGRRNLARMLEPMGFEVLGWRSLGRYYRLRYVFDRLRQLYQGGPLRWGTNVVTGLFSPFREKAVYLSLGDVLGVVARRAA
jgi:2-polyprenyl-3-methyl-5-hydroxy-6-metoxy-1,4-benzoquinol methylase